MTKRQDALHVVTVDQIDGAIATLVFENRSFALPLSLLPRGVQEGDALTVNIRRDQAATAALKRDVGRRHRRLADDDDGGDRSL